MENTLQHFINNPTGKKAAWSSGQRVGVAIQPYGIQAPPWPLAGFVFWSFRVQTIKRENLQQHIDVVIGWKIVSHGLRISFNAAQHYTEWRELECCRYFHHARIPSRVELCREWMVHMLSASMRASSEDSNNTYRSEASIGEYNPTSEIIFLFKMGLHLNSAFTLGLW